MSRCRRAGPRTTREVRPHGSTPALLPAFLVRLRLAEPAALLPGFERFVGHVPVVEAAVGALDEVQQRAIADALRQLPHYREAYPEIELPATAEVVLEAMEPARFARWREKK